MMRSRKKAVAMSEQEKIDALLGEVYARAKAMRVSGRALELAYQRMKREAGEMVASAELNWQVWCAPVSCRIHDLLEE